MPDYRRRLPHIHPNDAYLFLTWRLWGSIPLKAGEDFPARERVLDQCASGPRWLADPEIANLVSRAILIGECERHFYQLCAWAVMPNHVHLLMLPLVPVAVMMRWLKGSTARGANRILGRTGRPFWQDESFDHYVRSSNELAGIKAYVEENPVTAGLVSSPESWRWSSAGWQAEPPAPPNQDPLHPPI
jgi:REP element-mobilizing transposase RayT